VYVNKIKKRNGKTQKLYEYLHLVESVRTDKGPRQRLILNLGNLDLPPSQYQAFAKRVEDILTGQHSFTELDEDLEKKATESARKIFKKQSSELSETAERDFQSVDVNSLATELHRSLGAEYVCHSVWQELGMDTFFLQQGVTAHVLPILEALIVGRLIDPGSERHTKQWVEKRSALYELTGLPLRRSLNSYYRAGDTLFSHKKALEEHLCTREKDMFSLSEKLFFFDLTNSYFEGQASGNPKANFGHSKEKRSDCKLVTLGLIIDELGFSKYSEMFAGNQNEAETLAGMIKSLEQHIGPQADRTVVIDAGIGTEDNIKWLKDNNYHYISVNRGECPFDEDFSEMTVVRENESEGSKIEVKRYVHEGEVYILCRSKKKTKKEQSMRTRVEELFVERLAYYKAGLSLPQRTKKYSRVVELVGRLKEKYPRAAKLYDVEVIPEDKPATSKTLRALDIVWQKKTIKYDKETSREGSYILRTDRVDLTDEEIWNIYIMLNQVEYAFMSIKSCLGLRPIFHQKENRVDIHMFISVLAYHILHVIESRLKAKGDSRKWSTLREVLSTHEQSTIGYMVRDEDGTLCQEYVRLSSNPEPEHQEIFKMLDLSGAPLPRKRLRFNR
jgi:transposase